MHFIKKYTHNINPWMFCNILLSWLWNVAINLISALTCTKKSKIGARPDDSIIIVVSFKHPVGYIHGHWNILSSISDRVIHSCDSRGQITLSAIATFVVLIKIIYLTESVYVIHNVFLCLHYLNVTFYVIIGDHEDINSTTFQERNIME